MNNNPSVSILINNYNYERYVGEAIDSALGQDYDQVEIVVVDDGSTDRSRDVIRRYGARIVPILQPNGGQGAAYNAGFAACHGDLVIFLDADDRLYPNAVTEVVKAFDDDVVKVQFNQRLIDGVGRPLGGTLFRSSPDSKSFRTLLGRFLSYPHSPGSGNAYRRRLVDKTLPLPVEQWRISADACLIFAAPLDGKVVHIQDCLGEYRRHGAGASDFVADNLVAYIDKEYEQLRKVRDYTAQLLAASGSGNERRIYGFEPNHLKLAMAKAFLCHTDAPSVLVKAGFIKQAIQSAMAWTPWPIVKRCALPLWVFLVSVCPHQIGARALAASMMRGLPKSSQSDDSSRNWVESRTGT